MHMWGDAFIFYTLKKTDIKLWTGRLCDVCGDSGLYSPLNILTLALKVHIEWRL